MEQLALNVDELFGLIQSGRIEDFYGLKTTAEFRKLTSLPAFRKTCDHIARQGALKSKKIGRLNAKNLGSECFAEASYAAEFEQGPGTIYVAFMIGKNGWLLQGLRVASVETVDDPAKARWPYRLPVIESESVNVDEFVDVLDPTVEPARVVVSNVRVILVSWDGEGAKVLPPAPPPATGFAGIMLTESEFSALSSTKLSAFRLQKARQTN